MKMLNNEVSQQLKEVFQQLDKQVTIALFTDGDTCNTCPETSSYMEELQELSDKLVLKKLDINKDAALAAEYKVTLVPSIVLLDADDTFRGVKFNGIPAGHEINSFISALLEVSGASADLPEDLSTLIAAIDKPMNIKVFVTLSCPHCPGAVQKAHKLALMNDNIDAEMIEAQTFPELSQKFNVSGVPKIVINDSIELVGNQPINAFVEAMTQ